MNRIRRSTLASSALSTLALLPLAACASTAPAMTTAPDNLTVHGYVIDSACAFIKDLDKPISKDCAIRCANAGSPLVILADDGMIYWPISPEMPALGMNERLLAFAGDRVVATGKEYMKGGACGFVMETIEMEPGTAK